MTTLVGSGDLLCSNLSVKQIVAYEDDAIVVSWIKMAAANFVFTSPDYHYLDEVLEKCVEIFDPTDTEENPQAETLALALHARDKFGMKNVVVVTDQWVDSPLVSAQGPAASNLLLEAMRVEDFISELLGVQIP
ncbi:hypothetical protein [Glutamicibacter nicotianae]|nr:hypothetical protein [Glutamicibacter nicotianae]